MASDDPLNGILSDDNRVAAEAYRKLRTKLVKLLSWRGASSPEELADEVVLRVIRALLAGVEIRESIAAFSRGVALNVLLEDGRKRKREVQLDPESLPPSIVYDKSLTAFETRLFLDRCLASLSAADRELVVDYFTRDRVELARERGISAGALRVRVHRLLKRLRNASTVPFLVETSETLT